MDYIKVKVSFKPAPERFYRVLLVPENVKLDRLAQIIGTALHVEWEHMFQFRKGKVIYQLLENDLFGFGDNEYRLMHEHTVEALGEKAVFEYDFGEGWEFDLRIYKRRVARVEDDPALLIEGEGQGIWEDNIGSLMAYLNGEIDDDIDDPEESGYALPWNFENDSFSDFDETLDLTAEEMILDMELMDTAEEFFGDMLDDNDEDDDDTQFRSFEEDMMAIADIYDKFGVDKAIHKCVLKALTDLRARYDEDVTNMLVHQMLVKEVTFIVDNMMPD